MPYKDPIKRKEYHKKYSIEWEKNNKEKRIGYYRKFYYKHREEILLKSKLNRKKNEQSYQVRARRYHRKKIEIFKRYGGETPKCVWCGEERYECLQIDHIYDDGNKERNSIGGGENFYYWLLKQPYQPERYQILCANCNCIKRIRGIVSYQNGLKNIKEWEEWSKRKNIPTPEKLKKLWKQKMDYREKELKG